ncbi:MFS transporter [Kribbella antibiotica]|uniref:MFS transporter n=1 Tax=Kribbella antibiotica TaxID=190195 RepID=UPI0014047997|nr:MFS transporter [Kribbella antibiotica]
MRGRTITQTRPDADLTWYWSSQTASFAGDRLTGFAVPSIAILSLNASSAQVGVLSALGWFAYPAFGLVAGAALPHIPRRRVMIIGEVIRFAVFATIPLAAALGGAGMGQLFVVVAVAGVAMVFVDVAGQSYLPALVEPQHLVGANALIGMNARVQSSDSASKLVGPALAGLLLRTTGSTIGMLLSTLPFLASAYGRTRITTVEPPVDAAREPMLQRIRTGFDFVRRHPILRRQVGAAAVRSFGSGMVDAVLLLFAYRVLGLSSLAGGLLIAAGSVGGLLGAFGANRLAIKLGTRRVLLLTSVEALCWLAIPLCLVTAPAITLVLIRVLAGGWLPVWNVVTTSVRQQLTPAALQSTVHATARTLTSSTVPLGALTGGFAGGVLSSQLGAATGLVLVLAAGGVIAGSSALLVATTPREV